ncbi:MAG: hypothetical protein WCP35_04375 [Verrucomicrobiota bacterium]
MKHTLIAGLAALVTAITRLCAVSPDLATNPMVDTTGTNHLGQAGAFDPEYLFSGYSTLPDTSPAEASGSRPNSP